MTASRKAIRGKSHLRRELLGLSALVSVGHAAHAGAPVLPQGGQFVAGSGVIGQAGPNGLRIDQQSVRGVIDWRSFSIGQGGSVVINNGQGATLNRVTGGQISQIEGRLSATGSVYLLNPQGVVIGANGKVIGGGSVVVSTRDIANGAFMAGGALTASGTSAGDVTNFGTLVSRQGDVILIGRAVSNSGSLAAANGTADLAAGDSVVMAPVDGVSGVYVVPDVAATGDVTQAGRIKAAAAALTAAGGDVYTLAGNRSGLIEAQGTATIAGHVWLSAPNGRVSAGGEVTARNAGGSGGEIVAHGGKATTVTGALDASGLMGGLVYVGVTGPQTGLSATTTIADGARIAAGGAQGGGQVETSGHVLNLGQASVSTGKGGAWLLDPYDLTIDQSAANTISAALTGGADVTETTTAGSGGPDGQANSSGSGDITVSGNIAWSGANGGNLTLSAYRIVTLEGSISSTTTAAGKGGLTIAAGTGTSGAITLSSGAVVSTNTVSMTATGGNLTIGSGASITGQGAVQLGTTANFVNNGGASAVSSTAGTWRIYSTKPTQDVTGGLTPDFYQYATALGGTVDAQASGSGLIYSTAPTVAYALTGSVSKVYDGYDTIAVGGLTASNLTQTGGTLFSGDSLVPVTGAGTYSQSDVGSSLTVTLTGGVTVVHGAIPVYGYAFDSGSVNQAVIGAITARPLTVDIIDGPNGVTKIYDGNTTAQLNTSNFQITGLAPGDTGTVSISPGPYSAVYTGTDAGTGHTAPDVGTAYGLTVELSTTNYVSTGDIKLTNYSLPTRPENDSRATLVSPYANARITAAPLELLGVTAQGKTYDGTATATVTASGIAGVVGGDNVSLSGFTASFSNGGEAGGDIPITYSAQLTGDALKLSDYTVTLPTLTASISKAPVTLTGLAVLNGGKSYDATTTAVLDTSGAQLNQVIGADAVGFDASNISAQYAQADVGQNIAVSIDAASVTLTGAKAGDYSLSIPSITGNITPALLTVHLAPGAASKIYDGDAQAAVDLGAYSITGWQGGQGGDVSIVQTASASYTQGGSAQANAGSGYDVTATVTPSDFLATGSTKLSNYYTSLIGGTPTLNATVVSSGGNSISPAPLTIQIVGNPTKTYDDTTAITLASSNFQISGFVNGEQATVVDGVAGAFASANAGSPIQVTATLNTPADFSVQAGTSMSNYVFTNPVTGYGTINPAPLAGTITASLGALTKIYDGTNTITLVPSDFVLTGWQGSDGSDVTVTQTQGLFATKNAGTQTVAATLDNDSGRTGTTSLRGDFASTTTDLLDYTLPTFAAGTGRIDPKAITLTIIGTPTKTYNGTVDAPNLTSLNYQVNGAVAGETITVTQPIATYNSKDVAAATTVSAHIDPTNLSISGSDSPLLSNYTLGVQGAAQTLQGTATGAGTINLAQLYILQVGANDKTYDGTTSATLNFSTADSNLFGVVSGEDVHLASIPLTGDFSTFHAGSNLTVTPTQPFALTGADIANYHLNAPALAASITAKTLTISGLVAQDRTYDAATDATVDASGAGLVGVVGSDPVSLNVTGATASFASEHVGTAIPVSASGYALSFSDSAYDGDYVLAQPSGLTASITPAQLYGQIINTPTKTYDGSTTVTLTGGMGGSSSFQITGWQGSDGAGVTIDHAAVAQYLAADAGSQTVDATLLTSSFVGASNLSDYYLPFVSGSPSQSVGHIQGAGLINKAPLTAQITGDPTRVYNAALNYDSSTNNTGGNSGVGLLSSNYTLSGFATGEGSDVTISQADATFNVADVGIRTLTATLDTTRTDANHYGVFTSTSTNLDNYILPTTASGGGTITPFHITVAGVTANDKVYNTNGTFTLNNSGANLVGVFAADSSRVSIGGTASTGASTDGVDVGLHQNISISAGSYGLSGAAASDYVIDSVNAPSANITPASLTLKVVKTYDASDDAGATDAGNVYSLVGVLGTDNVALGSNSFAGTYSSADVDGVTASPTVTLTSGAVNLTGIKAADYQVTAATGVINPLHVSVQGAVAQDKTYDGTTSAQISNTSTQLVGVLSADQATIQLLSDAGDGSGPQLLTSASLTAGTFASPDVAYDSNHNLIAVAVSTTGYSLGGNTHQDYVLDQPTGLSAVINPSTLLVTPNGVTKVYDGTGALPTSNLSYSLANVLAADDGHVFVDASLVTGSFDGVGGLYNVGTNLGVHLANLSLTGDRSGDYQIASTFSGNIGTIKKADLTASIAAQTKVYDGSTTAAGLLGQYIITGVNGEVATVDLATGAYNSANVAGANTVTVSGLTAGDFSDAGSTGGTVFLASNYNLPGSISGVGAITKASLTASILDQTKTYDGVTTASGLLGQYVITGVNGEKATLNVATGAYDSANVLGATTVTVSGLTAGNFSDGGSTGGTTFLAGNYNLPGSISGTGAITKANLTSSILAQTKTYDGTTAADDLLGQYAITGVHGEKATVDVATGAYNDANVLGASTVTVTGLTASDFSNGGSTGGTSFLTSNYNLPTTISGSGTITKASLTASIDAQTKVYDGTTTASGLLGQYVITGVNGEIATVDVATGAYNSANVASANAVTVGGLTAGDFSDAGSTGSTTFLTSNYNLPSSISGSGVITKASLTASIADQTKTYDGTTTASGLLGQYLITGVNGEKATLDVATGAYDSANVLGATTVTVSGLTAGDFSDGGSTGGTTFLAGNYNLPASISGAGSITKANLSSSILSQTKTYDGTTVAGDLLGQYAITGVHGEKATVDVATGAYNDADVLGATTVSVGGLTASDFSDGGSTGGTSFLTSNYNLPTAISGSGTITKASLTASIGAQTKVYDGAATASGLLGQYTITGVNGEVATVDVATGAYNSANVASATTVTVSGLTAGDFSDAGSTGSTTFLTSNYNLPAAISGSGTITKASLTASIAGQTKTYDGTTTASGLLGQYLITGVNGEKATLDVATGAYDSANVLGATTVTVSGLTAGDFSDGGSTGGTTFLAGNYNLPASISGAGSITKAGLTASILDQTKTYDGTTTASGLLGQYLVTGVNGEKAAVDVATGVYNDPNVLGAATVTVSGLTAGDFSDGGSTGGTTFLASNYVLPTSISGAGAITPRAVTATFDATSKVYDQTLTTAPLTGWALQGFIAGQGATMSNAPATGLYGVKDVTASPQTVTASLTGVVFTGQGATVLSNYSLPSAATGLGVITPAPLFVANLKVKDKVYDGTTAAQLDLSGVTASSLQGVLPGDDVTLSALPGAAVFATPNVGTGITITLAGQAVTGADARDYVLSASALPTASITPRPLTATIVGTPTKVYDGGDGGVLTAADFQLSNFVAGEGATVTQTAGIYAAPDAGARTVSASLAGGDFTAASGTLLSNYILPVSASGAGLITPRPLTATIVGNPSKFFDGSADATLTPDNFQLTGFVGGQGATVSATSGTYSDLGPSFTLTVTAQLKAGDFALTGGANFANYVLPTVATGPGAIKPPPSSDLYSRYETQLVANGVAQTPRTQTLLASVVFSVATPRIYIPFPAPGALSTWKGNGFGSLPIVVDETTDTATDVGDGSVTVQSGPPMINNTEQVLLQGVRSKRYRIMLPTQASSGPSPAAQ